MISVQGKTGFFSSQSFFNNSELFNFFQEPGIFHLARHLLKERARRIRVKEAKMESTLLYNLPDLANSAMPLGWPIAVYFFLTGSLAGLYITSVIATLMKKEEWQPIAKFGAVGAVVLLMTAPVLLIIDLNQPLRFWHLFVYMNPTSPLTWGSYFPAPDAVVCLVYTYYVLQNNTQDGPSLWDWAAFRLPSPDTATPGFSWPFPKPAPSGIPP